MDFLRRERKFITPVAIYLTVDVLDYISSYLILSRGGVEVHPIGRYMAENLGFPVGMIISKIPHVLIPLFFCYLMNVQSRNHDVGNKVMYFLSLFPTLTSIHNFGELLMK